MALVQEVSSVLALAGSPEAAVNFTPTALPRIAPDYAVSSPFLGEVNCSEATRLGIGPIDETGGGSA